MTVFMPGFVILGILVLFGVKNLYDDFRFGEYACPNCGYHFSRTFVNTLCSEMATYMHPKSNYLKCPNCKVRDECSSLDR